jgi:hypothetical protein
MKIYIYSLYYDDETKRNVPPCFIPLDNTKNDGKEWFEFKPILNFFENNQLEEGAWYGFLSPKFSEKTGYEPAYIFDLISNYGHSANVALFSPGWDQLSYFLNPWEQGEIWHPGIINESQNFLNSEGLNYNLKELVTDTSNSVFSNYIIAKKEYWLNWFEIAKLFYCYAENPKNLIVDRKVSYGFKDNKYPLKAFIQERLATLVLSNDSYKVLVPDQSLSKPIFSKIFSDDANTRRLLITCDLLKKIYRNTLDRDVLKTYWITRRLIAFSPPK